MRRASLLAFVTAAILALSASSADTLDVYFIDVGHGDAILVDYNNWECLIDAGKGTSTVNHGLMEVLGATVQDSTIELCVLSHNHWDHFGGFVDVFPLYVVDAFWRSADVLPDCDGANWKEFSAELAKECSEPEELSVGITPPAISPPELAWTVLAPGVLKTTPADENDNENSLVLLLEYGEVMFLFAGDIQSKAESVLQTIELPEAVLILKVAHHGSNSSTSTEFLKWADPELAIVSADSNDLHAQVAVNLGHHGIPFLQTFNNGTICVSTDGNAVWVTTETLAGAVVSCSDE